MRRLPVLRRIATLALIAAPALLFPLRSHAQTFGQFTGGSVVPMEGHTLGGAVEFSGDLFAAMGQFRTSFQPGMDFGFQGGLGFYSFDGSNQTSVRLGADFKAQVAKQDAEFAVDVVLGAGIGIENADDLNVLRVGPSVVVSRSIGSLEDPRARPFVGLQFLFERDEVGDESESGLMVPFHLGSELRLTQGLRFCGEIQFRIGNDFGDDWAITTGITTDF